MSDYFTGRNGSNVFAIKKGNDAITMACTGEWVAEAGSAAPVPKGMELLVDGHLDIHLEGFCHRFLADGVSHAFDCSQIGSLHKVLGGTDNTCIQRSDAHRETYEQQ